MRTDQHIRYLVIEPTGNAYGYSARQRSKAETSAWFGDRKTQLVDMELKTVANPPGQGHWKRYLTQDEITALVAKLKG